MNNIDKKLNNIKTKKLSQVEKDTLWQGISNNLNKEDNLSIFNLMLTRKSMINIIVALLLVFGGSIATVQASDDAKPGDILYGIDRAVENIQIKFASKENKDKLKIKFAGERIVEMQSVIEENLKEAQELKEIEVKIYTNETEVKVESAHDKKFKFTLDLSDQAEIIAAIAERFEVTVEEVGAVIRFEIKNEDNDEDGDEDHDNDDDDYVSNTEEIEESIQVALDYMIKVRNELLEGGNDVAVVSLGLMIESLQDKLADLPEDLKVELEIEEDGDKTEFKLELKDENGKFKIKYKSEDDGDIKIELEDKSEDKDHDDDKDDDHDEDEGDKDHDSGNNQAQDLKEIEVKIYKNKTEVKGESANDKKFKFTLDLSDQTEIIAAIAERFEVTVEEVGAVIRFEIKNEDNDKDDDDHDSDDDDDDDDNTTSTDNII